MKLPYGFEEIEEITLKKNSDEGYTYYLKGKKDNQQIELIAENVDFYSSSVCTLEKDDSKWKINRSIGKCLIPSEIIGIKFCPYQWQDELILFTLTINEEEKNEQN